MTVGPSTEVTISIAVPSESKGQTNTERPANQETGKQEEPDNIPVNESASNDKGEEIVSNSQECSSRAHLVLMLVSTPVALAE